MIPLMKNTFIEEQKTKQALSKFIISTPRLSMSEQCSAFEKKFAHFQGVKEAILFNSGGSSNLAMLQTLKNMGKLKDGDKIAFSSLTWATNTMPIIQLGFQPVPIDCEFSTLNVMSDNLQHSLDKEKDISAFFVTNVLGFCGDLEKIKEICENRDVILLEDNCEALGTETFTGKTGSFGEMSSFSFFVAHHMSTIEGGMVCTNDENFAEMLRIVRANGWDRNLTAVQQQKWRKKFNIQSEFQAKYSFYDLGYNLRPTEITGFLGCQQIKFLDENIKKREKNYLLLEKVVIENPDLIAVNRQHISLISNFAFPVLCKNKETKELYLSQFAGAGVEIRPMIAGNIQNQPFYKKYTAKCYELDGTDEIYENSFYCGNYPELTDADLETLSSCLSKKF